MVDEKILGGGTCLAVLEEVVEVGEGDCEGFLIFRGDGCADGVEIVDGDLAVELAVEGEDGATNLAEIGCGVEGDEGAHPWGGELLSNGIGRRAIEGDGGALLGGEMGGERVGESHGLGGEAVAGEGVHHGEKLRHELESEVDQMVGCSAEGAEVAVLTEENMTAVDARGGEENEGGDLGAARGDDGSNKTALAMAENGYAAGVDMLVAAKRLEEGFHIVGEVEGGGVAHLTGGAAHATVVVAEDRKTSASQIVGQEEERLVAEDFLVAVLLTGARDENDGRMALIVVGKGERAVDVDGVAMTILAVDGEGLLSIGEWLKRRLGAGERPKGVGGSEGEMRAEVALTERAFQNTRRRMIGKLQADGQVVAAKPQGVALPRGAAGGIGG